MPETVLQPGPNPPDFTIDFPALFIAADWVTQHCIIPDGFDKGKPFDLVDWQAWCLLNFYRLKPTAQLGQLATAFNYRRGQIVLPQKAGKAPYTAAHICVEGVGPALFGGWAEGGEVWDCRDHGCGCGWVYEYQPGEGMAISWPTPLIQVTAYSEEQTDNIYDALRPMIDDGPLHELIPKTGEEFIRLPNKGRIDVVTSNAQSRLGARVTFVPQDETGIWLAQNGMIKVAETQRRGLAGMGGRAEETTNGWDPSEKSVAQRTAQSSVEDIFRHHPLPPDDLDYAVKEDRELIHGAVYVGSTWVDLEGIEAEAAELIETDPAQAERFFGNRIVAGAAKAFDMDVYRKLRTNDDQIERGRVITLGFDGALVRDATGLVATDVETGLQVALNVWERPRNIPDTADWMVPVDEVDEAVRAAFDRWDVWRMYADPPYWKDDINRWAGEFGDDRVILWWTNHRKRMAYALKQFKNDMREGVMSWGGPEGDRLEEHMANAVRRNTNMRDEDDDSLLWLISKASHDSKEKIDLAMCACLSWECRGDAIREGVLNKPKYERASW
jgi:hypothetical protein